MDTNDPLELKASTVALVIFAFKSQSVAAVC